MKLIERVTTLPNTNKAIRDKALLLIGFGGDFRRSELASWKLSNVQDTDYGIAITVRKSKTDQMSKGIIKSFVYGKLPNQCPVRMLKQYIDHFELQPNDHPFLRVRKGRSIPEIMQQTGHRSQSQVADYIRLEQNIKNNAIVSLF